MNRAEEDYIKSIYELTIERKQSLIKSNELTDRLGFTDQSVNEMIKKLVQKHLVNFIPYKGISLTKKGKDVAIRMVRAHRIWEVFLTEKLGFSWENVHDAAEKLEHATPNDVLEKLYQYLQEPKYCQHGNPIPDFSGVSAEVATLSLLDAKPKDQFQLLRVLDHKDLLTYLNEQKIALDQIFEIIDKDIFNGMIVYKYLNETKMMTFKTASMLFGKIIKP